MSNKANKKACLSITLLILIILGLIFTSIVSGNPVGMDPPPQPLQIYIQNDRTIKPSSAPIQKNGDIYTFTDNILRSSLIIQTDNIIIDGAGFLLEGTGDFPFQNEFNGISLTNRKNVTIQNMTIREFGSGIMITSSSEVNIIGSQIFERIYFRDSCLNCKILENDLSKVEMYGSNNTIVANSFILPQRDLLIRGNNNVVSNNFFEDNLLSIQGNNNVISNNVLEQYGPITVGPNSHYNIVSKNNGSGLDIKIRGGSSNNEIEQNTISSAIIGIVILNSFENLIFNNTVTKCEIGIFLNDVPPSYELPNSTNNLFYRNNLIENIRDVHVDQFMEFELQFNFWDNSEEGNYYGNYNGTDANGDGIGDKSYVINANNQDRFPLMLPVGSNDYSNELLQSDPFPTTLAVASIATIALIGIGIVVYFKRNKKRID